MHLIHKDIYNKDVLTQPLYKFKGEVRAILRDENLNVVQDTGWIKNSFTTYGSQNLFRQFWWMSIGSGTGATLPGDTVLHNELDRDYSSRSAEVNTGSGGSYAFYETRWNRWEAGEATGTITEIGMNVGGVPLANDLICRQEITPIVKASYNVLDTYYKITVTPNIVDTTGSVTIDSIDYDYILRLQDADRAITTFSGVGASGCWFGPNVLEASVANVGGALEPGSLTNIVNTTTYQTCTSNAYLNTGNFSIPGGVRSALINTKFRRSDATYDTYVGVQFTATSGPDIGYGIPKDDTQYLHLNWKLTWAVV